MERVRYEVMVEPLHRAYACSGVRVAWSWLSARRSGSCCYGPVSVDTADLSFLSHCMLFTPSLDGARGSGGSIDVYYGGWGRIRTEILAVSTDTGP